MASKIPSWLRPFLILALALIITTRLTPGKNRLLAQTAQATQTPTSPVSTLAPPTAAPETPTAIPAPALWVAPYLPQSLIDDLELPTFFDLAEQASPYDLQLDVGVNRPIAAWIYALVAPFPTVQDGISFADLLSIWKNGPGPDEETPLFTPILVAPDTYQILEKSWGAPASSSLEVLPSERILDEAWQRQHTWAIIPFEATEPKWKVIEVDGQSPLHKDFNATSYPLTISFSIEGETANPQALGDFIETVERQFGDRLFSNRDPNRLTTVVLTGVTALVRGTAAMMELNGYTYPAIDIRHWLREADITHINNEVSFAPNCPRLHRSEAGLIFCSRPEYIELLEDIGTDIVELSGDHFRDWGDEAMLYTIEMYKERGWKYYGGGVNLEDGRKPLLIEHNGNRIAFLGCNAKDPGYAGATAERPGAVSCNFEWLAQEIQRLRADGYLPVITFQHEEIWTYKASPRLVPDFHTVAEAGAVIVSGSQAHQPQAIEFLGDSFLHYGLGNLFFDQYYEGLPTRQAFIDRHVFYDGRHINTELLSILFMDLARSRPMTPQERSELLETIFNVSGW